ncbi:MAG: formylglycine-generating enzyme family protein [Planctomycetota bacterium]|jgi:formylglycine-generating enzyme required for sulfatase activity|nr:formylglycine-generating enzyme family protein [Planctomycetota bacterium]
MIRTKSPLPCLVLAAFLPVLGTCTKGEFESATETKLTADNPAAEGQQGAGKKDTGKPAATKDRKAYEVTIPQSEVSFRMLPIPAGKFRMGCDANEEGAAKGESPAHDVAVDGFWMGATEVTWDEYQLYQFATIPMVDGVTGPTPPYVPMNFGMGVEGYPAISMTQYAARQYCKWLSKKTGHFYRLPTEAEWEYACRAGSQTPFHFNDASDLDDYAWYFDNSNDAYHPVGQKKPNAFGLFDMHGNVAEWVMDGFDADLYAQRAATGEEIANPLHWATTEYGRIVRGGGWDDDPKMLRSAARHVSKDAWKDQDPQLPKSIWYLTSAPWVGFRVVRPFVEPSAEAQERSWETQIGFIQEIQERQRRGQR